MPMSTSDASGGAGRRPATVPADVAASPSAAAAPDPSLRPGAESSDPAVHQLLAERETTARNGDEAGAQAATSALAALGYR